MCASPLTIVLTFLKCFKKSQDEYHTPTARFESRKHNIFKLYRLKGKISTFSHANHNRHCGVVVVTLSDTCFRRNVTSNKITLTKLTKAETEKFRNTFLGKIFFQANGKGHFKHERELRVVRSFGWLSQRTRQKRGGELKSLR